jgi:predicted component of type VI protein secretion system
MRKLVLITALLLASASAHAGDSRGLVLAANDTPAATDTAAPAAAPLPPAAPAAATTDAPKPQADAVPAKPAAAKPAKRASGGRHESDEAKARSIAARYGVYW